LGLSLRPRKGWAHLTGAQTYKVGNGMAFHVPEKFRIKSGPYGSDSSIGNNGLFEWGTLAGRIRVIASDGGGWEHISVSFEKRTPTWDEMCKVKDIFWESTDCVFQFHPSSEEYVNFAKHCLHLWRPTNESIPIPPSWMVGPRSGISGA
jgi:hypothetical protein